MINKALKFINEEIDRLKAAPRINGCEMTEEWKEQLDICRTIKRSLLKELNDEIQP